MGRLDQSCSENGITVPLSIYIGIARLTLGWLFIANFHISKEPYAEKDRIVRGPRPAICRGVECRFRLSEPDLPADRLPNFQVAM